jgi:hypothetical protein
MVSHRLLARRFEARTRIQQGVITMPWITENHPNN